MSPPFPPFPGLGQAQPSAKGDETGMVLPFSKTFRSGIQTEQLPFRADLEFLKFVDKFWQKGEILSDSGMRLKKPFPKGQKGI